jgi:hypothetical protein
LPTGIRLLAALYQTAHLSQLDRENISKQGLESMAGPARAVTRALQLPEIGQVTARLGAIKATQQVGPSPPLAFWCRFAALVTDTGGGH